MGSERVGRWVCATVAVRVALKGLIEVEWLDVGQVGSWGDREVVCWDGLVVCELVTTKGYGWVVETAFGMNGGWDVQWVGQWDPSPAGEKDGNQWVGELVCVRVDEMVSFAVVW
eukprot:CAMPEP_0170113540 /NCGR_PEP_ID=MMETSP0020_2-20130122/9972_1 /TAXON_ID=98059 /ORGANISM="Dinobryon sp., Strain UTEXLB2267" /LENGTH=113 /DNA_ID=CAMNT_0010339961 /DNA_START=926 /DNA_END=1264 /DNA_ORIENTATION=-